jgi:hypothetical protein
VPVTTTPPHTPLAADLEPVRGRRRRGLIAAGALLASVGALGVVWLVGAAGQRIDVVVVRQDVAYGEPIDAGDLGVARVSVDPGVAVVPADGAAALVGQVATTRLSTGMLLAPGMVATAGEPAPGRVLVPIALPAERMPAGGLRAGDRVIAVDAGTAADPTTPGVASVGSGVPALVVRVGAPDVNGTTVVDVTTTPGDGPWLAVAAANGRVALVVQPSGT